MRGPLGEDEEGEKKHVQEKMRKWEKGFTSDPGESRRRVDPLERVSTTEIPSVARNL